MSEISQVERQMYILSLLSENKRGFTTEEIMHSLHKVGIDVSRKTVERDIDTITANFFVYEDERDGKTVYQANKYSIQHISFTIAELISLYFSKEVLSSFSTIDVGVTAVRILDKLIASAPQIDKNYIENLKDLIKINVSDITPEKEVNPDLLEKFKNAIEDKKSITMEYYSFNGDEVTNRKFDPYLLEIQEGCWHAVGYCHLRNSIRDFRLSRIIKAEQQNETFERPENFYEKYKKDRFDKLAGEDKEKIVLKFIDNSARFVKEYEYKKADSITEEDGTIIFERTTAITQEIIRWILGFGAEVVVLEPSSLKKEIIEQIQKMAKLYQK